ncbi:Arp complex subunit [Mitosporidium daphniae]
MTALLDVKNFIIINVLTDFLKNAKDSLLNSLPLLPISHAFCDFDQVMYQLNAEEKANNISILVSISAPCVEQLNKLFSIPAEMKKFYPHASDISLDPISFSLSLNFELDLDADNAKAIENISLLKRNLFSIPFYHAISLQESDCQNSQKPFMFAYRPDEYVFIKPYSDRIVAIFQLRFKGNDDTIIAKVFIQALKASIHTRERARVGDFIQVLNRAKIEPVEKKLTTMTGRTFVKSSK